MQATCKKKLHPPLSFPNRPIAWILSSMKSYLIQGTGGVDFVEIYNQSDKFIDLNAVTLGNKESILITSEHVIIEPMQHIAISSDPSILNNQYS